MQATTTRNICFTYQIQHFQPRPCSGLLFNREPIYALHSTRNIPLKELFEKAEKTGTSKDMGIGKMDPKVLRKILREDEIFSLGEGDDYIGSSSTTFI